MITLKSSNLLHPVDPVLLYLFSSSELFFRGVDSINDAIFDIGQLVNLVLIQLWDTTYLRDTSNSVSHDDYLFYQEL